jgi:hypothetical protein
MEEEIPLVGAACSGVQGWRNTVFAANLKYSEETKYI